MNNEPVLPPGSPRAKIVHFIWRNLPRFTMLALFLMVFILSGAISSKKEALKQENESTAAPEKPLINTVTLKVLPSTIKDKVNLPGLIEPWTALSLMAKVRGSITEILVTEGDHVEEGDILARIEDNDYKIALERAEASYSLAKTDYERDKKVHAKGAIPTAQLEAKQTALQTSKADLENAKLQLSRCTITAPISGVINKIDAKIGLFLSVGDPIAELLKIDKVKAVVGIPESDIAEVRSIQSVDLTIKALNDKVVTGKLHFLSSAPENIARSYRMELAVDNSDDIILPGMFIRALIVKKEVQNALAVPFYSIITKNDSHFLFVEKDGVVEKRVVELGIMEHWMVQITKGLHDGDNVIIEGQRDVEDGQKVKVVKAVTDMEQLTL